MEQLRPVTRATHESKYWRRPSDYKFASRDSVCQLVAHEAPKAMLAMPIAFIKEASGYSLVAVQGLEPSGNLFVDDLGRWIGGYVPATYRGYPFSLGDAVDGRRILCINESSGLLTDESTDEPFFSSDGPSTATTEILNFLGCVHNNREISQKVSSILAQHQLIHPWPISLQRDDGEQTIADLYRIDEPALNRLSAVTLLELRDSGALLTAYCQLLSMQHLPTLMRLMQESKVKAVKALPAAMDLEFLNTSGNINFGEL